MLHWIIDRDAHREAWRQAAPEEGTEIDSVFGKAKVISAIDPGDVWLCDNCNADTGDQGPLIPSQGSYALCWDCAEKTGELPPRAMCQCEGCWSVVSAMASMAGVEPGSMARSLIVYLGTKGRHLWDTNWTETRRESPNENGKS